MISEKALAELSYPEAPLMVTNSFPGPKAQQLVARAAKVQTPTRMAAIKPVAWEEARGATLKDVDGNIFVDAVGGVGVSSVGRVNPKIVETIMEQAQKLMHTGNTVTTTGVALAERISDIMPEGLRGHCFTSFGQSGSAAVEQAIKYSRAITGKSQIIAFEGGYHGVWCGSLALTTRSELRNGWGPLVPGVMHQPYAYCYRCFAGLSYPSCEMACASYFDYKLNTPLTGADDVAAVIVEPLQGEGGYVDPPPEFLPMIKAACEETGALFIADEIQCGAGRSGKMWAIEHYGVEPDMLLFGKGIGCDLPMTGIVVHEKFANKLPTAVQPNTFEENALAAAVALTNIDILTDNKMDLIGRAHSLGERMKNKIIDAADDIAIIGEVRGKGLFIGVELVNSKTTREPFTNMKNIFKKAYDRGVLLAPCGRYNNTLRFMPALTITEALFTKAVDIVLTILKEES